MLESFIIFFLFFTFLTFFGLLGKDNLLPWVKLKIVFVAVPHDLRRVAGVDRLDRFEFVAVSEVHLVHLALVIERVSARPHI